DVELAICGIEGIAAVAAFSGCVANFVIGLAATRSGARFWIKERLMDLGRFSISLTVKDIKASRAFYQKLGFEVYDDHEKENWLILRSGETFIGLFQGM